MPKVISELLENLMVGLDCAFAMMTGPWKKVVSYGLVRSRYVFAAKVCYTVRDSGWIYFGDGLVAKRYASLAVC